MLRKYTIYLHVLAVMLFTTSLVSGTQKTLRIRELIPESWVICPAIEPAIPTHYVLAEIGGHAVWGTKEDIAICEKEAEKIQSELISFRHTDVLQTGPNTFSMEKELEQTFVQMGVKEFKATKLSQGKYPVLAIEGLRPDNTRIHAAWVGLNSPDGLTIFMNLFLPRNFDKSPTVWNTLLAKTEQLNEADFIRAQGMDMQEGYTTYSLATASVKATVEKRISDSLVAVMIEPLSPMTTYEIENIEEYLMGTEWKYKEPCTKIFGKMKQSECKYGTIVDLTVITVLTKNVNEFSFSLDQDKHPKGTIVQKLPYKSANK